MSPFLSFLVSVLYGDSLLKVALSVHNSRLPKDPEDLKSALHEFLPLHCKTGPIVEIEEIFEVAVVPESATSA